MKQTKLLKQFIKDNPELVKLWDQYTPHFGGIGPHRYDGNDKYCSYCMKPKNHKPGSTK